MQARPRRGSLRIGKAANSEQGAGEEMVPRRGLAFRAGVFQRTAPKVLGLEAKLVERRLGTSVLRSGIGHLLRPHAFRLSYPPESEFATKSSQANGTGRDSTR